MYFYSVHSLLSVRGSSSLWIALKLCWVFTWPGKSTWFDPYCMWWPATERISSRPIEKWLVMVVFSWTAQEKNGSMCWWKLKHQNVLWLTELPVNMWKKKAHIIYIKISLVNNILKHFCSLDFSCYRYVICINLIMLTLSAHVTLKSPTFLKPKGELPHIG